MMGVTSLLDRQRQRLMQICRPRPFEATAAAGVLNFVSARGWRQICVRSHLFVESNLGSVQ